LYEIGLIRQSVVPANVDAAEDVWLFFDAVDEEVAFFLGQRLFFILHLPRQFGVLPEMERVEWGEDEFSVGFVFENDGVE
jgi:hypothetical protein